jgi:Ni/Co efflux regulator RcnB
MKYMITAALALCLIGGAASAQDREHERGGGRPEGHQGGGAQEHRGGGPQAGPQGGREFRGAPQGAPQGAPPVGQQRVPHQGPQGAQALAPQAAPQAQGERRGGGEFRSEGRAPGVPGVPGGQRGDYRGAAPAQQFQGGQRGEYRGAPAPGPGFRGEARRGPEPGYRPGFYARDHGYRGGGHFHVAPYYYPAGWGYQRWAFGAFLPFVFLAPDYTLYQYWVYGLPAPPPGYHWIRVGPDALLVRYGDGYVLDVVYGIFY